MSDPPIPHTMLALLSQLPVADQKQIDSFLLENHAKASPTIYQQLFGRVTQKMGPVDEDLEPHMALELIRMAKQWKRER